MRWPNLLGLKIRGKYSICSALPSEGHILKGSWGPLNIRRNYFWELYLFLFLFLYFSDATPFPPRALVFYISTPLAILGLLSYRNATSSTQFFLKVLTVSWAYQALIKLEIYLKPLLAMYAIFYVVTYYQQYGFAGLSRLKNMLVILFLMSFVLFLATLTSNAALEWRAYLYAGIQWENISMIASFVNRQGGLASTLFFFGYQVAAGVSLFFSEIIIRGFSISRNVRLSAMLFVGILTLVLCSERATLVAVVLAISAIGFMLRQHKKVVAIIICIVLLYFPVKQISEGLIQYREKADTFSRILDRSRQYEVLGRIEVQIWAIGQIPFYPLGLPGHGEYYTNLVESSPVEFAIAPHNGYVTRPLLYGWVLIGVLVIVFRRIYKMARDLVTYSLYEVFPVFAAFLAALATALFHNPSFLSFVPETIILMMLFGGIFDICKEEKAYQTD